MKKFNKFSQEFLHIFKKFNILLEIYEIFTRNLANIYDKFAKFLLEI